MNFRTQSFWHRLGAIAGKARLAAEMIGQARKHYGGSKAGLFSFLIHNAIWFRAALTTIGSFIRKNGLPIIDAGLILLSFWLMKNIWNEYVRTDIQYVNKLLWIAFPAYTVFYLIAAYYAGLYDRWYKWSELFRSSVVATIVLLAAYAMLPEQYRFSRAILLFGAMLAFALISLLRWILIQLNVLNSNKDRDEHTQTVIAGSVVEFEAAKQLLKDAGLQQRVVGRVSVAADDNDGIGSVKNIKGLSTVIPVREIIFCQGALSYAAIIESIQQLPSSVNSMIHAHGTTSIVGSNSKDSSGEVVSKENGFKLSDPYNRRIKRLIDVSISIFSLITFPVHLLFVKKPFSFFRNCFQVLFAKKTWIGYAVPELHDAVISCKGIPADNKQQLPRESLQMMDYWYARDYEPMNDFKLIRRMYRRLGG